MTSTDHPGIYTGTHAGVEAEHGSTPWPGDVPPNQDDTWYPLRDDPRRARRKEIQIAGLWMITALCGVGLMVDYELGAQVQIVGALFLAGFATMGLGMLMWSNNLLPGHEITASRGEHVSSVTERAAVVESLARGTDAMMARRGFLTKALMPALGLFGLGALWQISSLGPRAKNKLFHTRWYANARLVTSDNKPLRPSDLLVDGLMTVFPEGYIDDPTSLAVVLNVGSLPIKARPGQQGWRVQSGPNGIVAFSKICTHAGCPVSLYNALSHQLVCPCHQSTFDVLNDCKPVFGPAPRYLPQLPLGVDAEGYLVALSDFTEAVGPGFWNRG